MNSEVLCFRSFDLRDRFPEPVATFREALELLQSERAYMPEWSSEIKCYLASGDTISIPEQFFLCKKRRFTSREEAEAWVIERNKVIEKQGHGFARGLLVSNPNLPFEEQIEEAFLHEDTEVISPSENDRICAEVDGWLFAAIENLPMNKKKLDRQMIAHHEPSNTTLYHRIYMEDIQQNSVLLSVKNAKEATFVKDELTGYHVTVGIDPEAMDELAIAWCKHRKLQGALGGPVGKEWGSPDCDYD